MASKQRTASKTAKKAAPRKSAKQVKLHYRDNPKIPHRPDGWYDMGSEWTLYVRGEEIVSVGTETDCEYVTVNKIPQDTRGLKALGEQIAHLILGKKWNK